MTKPERCPNCGSKRLDMVGDIFTPTDVHCDNLWHTSPLATAPESKPAEECRCVYDSGYVCDIHGPASSPAPVQSAEQFKTVTDHKFIAQECHDKGCQFLVLTEAVSLLEKQVAQLTRERDEAREAAIYSGNKMAEFGADFVKQRERAKEFA